MDNLCYRIRAWDELYENAETRKLKSLRFVYVPNSHDGLAYRRLLSMRDGLSLFGAWILMLGVASKAPHRGRLVDERGNPLTAADIALMTGAAEEVLSEAIQVLSSPAIRWIEADLPESPGTPGDGPRQNPGVSGSDPGVPGSSPEKIPLKEGRKEGKEGNRNGNEPEDRFNEFASAYPAHRRKANTLVRQSYLRATGGTPEGHERLMGLLARVKLSEQWLDQKGKFVPGMEKFLEDPPWPLLDASPERTQQQIDAENEARIRRLKEES